MFEQTPKRLHQPVLIKEVIELLQPRPGKILVDATIGSGGHSELLLGLIESSGKLIGIDRDKETLNIARERLKNYQTQLILLCDNFINLPHILKELDIEKVDGVLLDLGISSQQLSDAERGFSFQQDGPMDMRMSRTSRLKASDIINKYSPERLVKIFQDYGEERWSKRIARNIIGARTRKRIERTRELVEIIQRAVPFKKTRIHPATRVFQALRIEVNGELDNLRQFLKEPERYLKTGGRLAIISFHSLEDRLVKESFREKIKQDVFKRITKKPIRPEQEEVLTNPRSRSARLRAVERS
ncbi:Ribosomal RNA small subunit methyltransferase H [subsurface metagenome]